MFDNVYMCFKQFANVIYRNVNLQITSFEATVNTNVKNEDAINRNYSLTWRTVLFCPGDLFLAQETHISEVYGVTCINVITFHYGICKIYFSFRMK